MPSPSPTPERAITQDHEADDASKDDQLVTQSPDNVVITLSRPLRSKRYDYKALNTSGQRIEKTAEKAALTFLQEGTMPSLHEELCFTATEAVREADITQNIIPKNWWDARARPDYETVWKPAGATLVTLNTTEAEFINLTPAAISTMWVDNLLEDLGTNQPTPLVMLRIARTPGSTP